MPEVTQQYRMADRHKHWQGGQCYKGAGVEGRTVGDLLVLTPSQAKNIEHKLIGAGPASQAPAPPVPKKEKKEVVEEPEKVPEKEVETKEPEKEPEKTPETDSTADASAPENAKPELRRRDDGEWDVVRGEETMNKDPMSLDAAKAMIAGMGDSK